MQISRAILEYSLNSKVLLVAHFHIEKQRRDDLVFKSLQEWKLESVYPALQTVAKMWFLSLTYRDIFILAVNYWWKKNQVFFNSSCRVMQIQWEKIADENKFSCTFSSVVTEILPSLNTWLSWYNSKSINTLWERINFWNLGNTEIAGRKYDLFKICIEAALAIIFLASDNSVCCTFQE